MKTDNEIMRTIDETRRHHFELETLSVDGKTWIQDSERHFTLDEAEAQRALYTSRPTDRDKRIVRVETIRTALASPLDDREFRGFGRELN